jgi:hypothetical protein
MQDDRTAALAAQIETLTKRLDAQELEIERLRGLAGAREQEKPDRRSNRRELLFAAGAAAMLAPASAMADVRAKLTTDTSAAFGALGAPGVDPQTLLPALGTTKHGVIGMADGKGMAPHASAGLTGIGKNTVAVQGLSTNSHGVYGRTAKATAAGVYAYSAVANGTALRAVAAGANGVAGAFSGAVKVNGTLNVNGDFVATGVKSAAVPHPDGSHRLVYCLESPQAWLEDFGEGTLTEGRGDVKLDPDFAALCEAGSCRIFISESADHHLHVTKQDASGFTVEADLALAALKGKSASDLSGPFSYRVVGRRKDRPGVRLETYSGAG